MSKFARAKDELRAAIVAAARDGRPLSYTEAARSVTSLRVRARSHEIDELLKVILLEEHAKTNGRLLLTAIVVREETGLPATAFFRDAEKLGYDAAEFRFGFWRARADEVWRAYAEAASDSRAA